MEDHRREVLMAHYIMPFALGVVGPLTLVGWVILR
jgi:hypothetical protein